MEYSEIIKNEYPLKSSYTEAERYDYISVLNAGVFFNMRFEIETSKEVYNNTETKEPSQKEPTV